jgi:hypothetical protein
MSVVRYLTPVTPAHFGPPHLRYSPASPGQNRCEQSSVQPRPAVSSRNTRP